MLLVSDTSCCCCLDECRPSLARSSVGSYHSSFDCVIVRCMSARWQITLLSRLSRTIVITHELRSNGATHTQGREMQPQTQTQHCCLGNNGQSIKLTRSQTHTLPHTSLMMETMSKSSKHSKVEVYLRSRYTYSGRPTKNRLNLRWLLAIFNGFRSRLRLYVLLGLRFNIPGLL